jgi:hypothetical protein
VNKNPNCDGGNCQRAAGPVKLYPLGGGGNLILCAKCWSHENRYRELRGIYYKRPEDFPQHDWATAKFYADEAS